MVQLLTSKQQKILSEMLEAGNFTARNGHDHQICEHLVEKGKAVLLVDRRNEWVYTPSLEVIEKKQRKPRGQHEAQRPVSPDPPKAKIKRPPAEYSNPQYDDMINNILKRK